jgi:hypothetical protein
MIGASRRCVRRAAELWEPLAQVVDAVGWWVPTADAYVVAEADPTRRGEVATPLEDATQAALLNAVLHASLLPDRSGVPEGAVPYLVPIFAPIATQVRGRGPAAWATQALALAATVDGVPLGELGTLPSVTAGERQTVVLSRPPSRHKVVETGSLTISVGVGPGPLPVLRWVDAEGRDRSSELAPGAPVPPGAPSWAASVVFSGDLRPLGQRELSLCFGVTSDLGRRASARLLAQFRPLVAGRLRNHELSNEACVRQGGLSSGLEDRSSDLFECLLHHVRNYVDKALREEGEYARELFSYVLACIKPAHLRSDLHYQPRTGHQSHVGDSVGVSELVAGLRRHARIHELTDAAEARAHHAVHWVLARHLQRDLTAGRIDVADLWAMWERGDLPNGVRIPSMAMWDAAVGHQVEHVPLFVPDDEDGVPAENLRDDEPPLPAGVSNRSVLDPGEEDLDLLLRPRDDAGFLALTSRVAARIAQEEPEAWEEALGEHRAVPKLLHDVLAPFAGGGPVRDGAARLYDLCTDHGRWRPTEELLAVWEAARSARLAEADAIA